ncbi:MAG: DUF1080 domain-containing protein [Planctomycetia bacterium]|nr:DUF1080 domain-containing protein [Planctomycetia bacterium]
MKYVSFLLACLVVFPVFAEDLEAVHRQQEFCLEVTRSGDVSQGDALGKLLLKEETNTAACTALANLPNGAGLPVLRSALDQAMASRCREGVVQTLGNLRDTASVEKMTAMLNDESTEVSVKTTLLKALGRIGKTDVLLPYLRADETLREAAADGMFFAARHLPPEDAAKCYQAVVDANVSPAAVKIARWNLDGTTLAPADVLGDVPSAEIQQPAPTLADLENLLKSLPAEVRTSDETLRKIAGLCRRLADKAGTLAALTAFYDGNPVPVVEIAAKMGTDESLVILKKYALSSHEAAVDLATKYLGAWPTYNVAPLLMELAQTLPSQKYRIRMLRGYIRIMNRWDIAVLEKKQMAQAVLAVAEREEERQMAQAVWDQTNQRLPEKSLFNGKDFTGWSGREDIFKVVDGAVQGGSLEKPLDRNEFLTTDERYRNFYLRLEAKIVGEKGNAGVQFRSERVPNHNEMVGYQADMTADGAYWGSLYDESRRSRFLQRADKGVVQAVWKPNDWNRYEILCDGPVVKVFINGVQTVEYSEREDGIPQLGLIGLQIHSGGPAQSSYRNLFITVKD